MSKPFEDIAKDAANLPREQRLSLANLLLELDEAGETDSPDGVWEEEIRARIRALDNGTASSKDYEDVMRNAESHLTQ